MRCESCGYDEPTAVAGPIYGARPNGKMLKIQVSLPNGKGHLCVSCVRFALEDAARKLAGAR